MCLVYNLLNVLQTVQDNKSAFSKTLGKTNVVGINTRVNKIDLWLILKNEFTYYQTLK